MTIMKLNPDVWYVLLTPYNKDLTDKVYDFLFDEVRVVVREKFHPVKVDC